MALLYFRRAGDIRARITRETGEQPMNVTRSEKVESTEVDSNLAAVSEVEAGIRDFVQQLLGHDLTDAFAASVRGAMRR